MGGDCRQAERRMCGKIRRRRDTVVGSASKAADRRGHGEVRKSTAA